MDDTDCMDAIMTRRQSFVKEIYVCRYSDVRLRQPEDNYTTYNYLDFMCLTLISPMYNNQNNQMALNSRHAVVGQMCINIFRSANKANSTFHPHGVDK